jgi:hypothetical protein
VNSRILRGGKNAKRQGAIKVDMGGSNEKRLEGLAVPIDLTLDRIAQKSVIHVPEP